jgi:hypothetical protein
MINHLFPKLTWAALFLAVSIPGFSQVAPSAAQVEFPLEVGAGFSDYRFDFGTVDVHGPTVWVDWDYYGPWKLLSGLGIEVEGRDLYYSKPANFSGNLRQDTAEGGVIYKWRDFHHVRPYGKFLLGYGTIEFPSNVPGYTHDSRTIYSPGFGLEYQVYRHISVRGDYEYQFWPRLFGPNALNPKGVTIGASYNFRNVKSR